MLRVLTPLASLVLVAFAAAGCSPSLSPEERSAACSTTDWRAYGENDGRLGVPTDDRADLFESCALAGQPVNLIAYQEGRAEGLALYCTVERGYEVGYEGRTYHKVCPPQLETAFLQGLEQGSRERPSAVYNPRYGYGVGSGARIGIGGRSGVGVGIGVGIGL